MESLLPQAGYFTELLNSKLQHQGKEPKLLTWALIPNNEKSYFPFQPSLLRHKHASWEELALYICFWFTADTLSCRKAPHYRRRPWAWLSEISTLQLWKDMVSFRVVMGTF